MRASGLLFLSRARPQLTRAADGTPQLLLRCAHRVGNHQTEAWTLTWAGQAAAEFFAAHGQDLTPGQPLSVTVRNLRMHLVGYATEIQCQVEACALAPKAQQQQQKEEA